MWMKPSNCLIYLTVVINKYFATVARPARCASVCCLRAEMLIRFVLIVSCWAVRVLSARTLAWLCLEFCGDNSTVTETYLNQIEEHKDILTAISFERYQLNAGAELVLNSSLTDVCCVILWFLRMTRLLGKFTTAFYWR